MKRLRRLFKAANTARLGVYLLALWKLFKHPETPRAARWVAVAVLAYAVSPIDLIPDFIPVIGLLDDLVLLPLGGDSSLDQKISRAQMRDERLHLDQRETVDAFHPLPEQLHEIAARYLHENALNPFKYPSLVRMEREVVAMNAALRRAGHFHLAQLLRDAARVARRQLHAAEQRPVQRPVRARPLQHGDQATRPLAQLRVPQFAGDELE